MNRAIIFHVDLDAGLLDDAADHLATRSDDVSNLIGRNMQGVNTWSVFRNLAVSFRHRLIHLVQNVQAALARLL